MNSCGNIEVLTKEEVLKQGLVVGRRILERPMIVRCADDLIIRSPSGCVSRTFGYFTEHHQNVRKQFASRIMHSFGALKEFVR